MSEWGVFNFEGCIEAFYDRIEAEALARKYNRRGLDVEVRPVVREQATRGAWGR